MLKNYLTIALRNIVKHRASSLLIVFGLALGMAVFMLATVYTEFNFSFDTFHQDTDRIHLIVHDSLEVFRYDRNITTYSLDPKTGRGQVKYILDQTD